MTANYYIQENKLSTEEQKQDKPKQVVILRQMFPNNENPGAQRKLRTGKYVAQAGHAYLEAALIAAEKKTPAWLAWRKGRAAKICLYVKTEEELLDVWAKVEASGLPSVLIQDSGVTEFDGRMTYTAIGIGPAFSSELAPLTAGLQLF